MNKRLNVWLSAAAAASIILAGCGGAATTAAPKATDAPAAKKLRVKLILNGTLGDKSFFDSANTGLDLMKSQLGFETKLVELSYDRNKWEPGIEDAAAADDYDVLVAGTFDMAEYMSKIAPKYPNKKFWYFEGDIDYAAKLGGGSCSNKCANVYSMYFKQNEGSYLVGLATGLAMKAKALKGIEDKTKVGGVGGMDIPGINDFFVGFKQGLKDAGMNPDDVIIQYVGGDNPWSNPARGKELAKSMYQQGAGVVWGVAGGSGLGVFEAAVEANAFSLGVDSDQYLTVADPKQRATIITSMLKNVGAGILRAAKLDAEGKLKYGVAENLGVAEDAVGFANNENYLKLIPQDIQKKVDQAAQDIKSGKIKVETALGGS
jgi:basic membrane protein A and related proteins